MASTLPAVQASSSTRESLRSPLNALSDSLLIRHSCRRISRLCPIASRFGRKIIPKLQDAASGATREVSREKSFWLRDRGEGAGGCCRLTGGEEATRMRRMALLAAVLLI